MRAIKFRAWDKTTNRMIYLNDSHDAFTFKNDGMAEYYNLQNGSGGNEYILMQSTCLKDKNKKEIYANDIVKCSGHNDLCIVHYANICACWIVLPYWKSYEYWKNDNEDDEVEDYYLWDNITIEIIGNIHENPELLK